ncbi:DNA-binding MarR family transcriptional regulator [Aureimonas jatrophae]|jgi:MarR family transcriptional regulator, transcriptional regulator for hemolysin|nr:MarR family winged helix-turn-helix transcriptional regulator [Aureimonas jatrophae]MBB3948953.1 DNA-binding MarR family transcriptional regulator [Aureimonas jatrophae]
MFGFLLTDTSRLFRQFFERTVQENGLGLTPGEIRTLGFTIRFRGSRQAVLAERMGVEPMTLSAYLDRLEARGLIVRTVDAADRRAKLIEPTEEAGRVMLELDPLFIDIYQRATRGMSDEEVTLMSDALQKLRSNLTTEPPISTANDFSMVATSQSASSSALEKGAD